MAQKITRTWLVEQDIAEELGVKPKTVHQHFVKSIEYINKILVILDARQSAFRHSKNFRRYSNDEKAFLLAHVFGFKIEEERKKREEQRSESKGQ